MLLSFTEIMNDISAVVSYFLQNVLKNSFDFISSQPLFFVLLISFCLMSGVGLLIDFLIDHNHLFSEYMKDSADVYVRDRKQREREAEREAKYESRRQKYRAQNKQDFIERQDEIDRRFAEKQKKIIETQKELYFAKKNNFEEERKPSYDIDKSIEKAENEPLVYKKKKKKE